MDIQRVKIESLAYGGYGIAKTSGTVCFIPYALPGDELLIEITGSSKGVHWGKILDVCTPSEFRYDPICLEFGECGGCHWLHLDYNEQIRWKTEIAKNALQRIGKICDPQISCHVKPSMMFGYRTRAKFHFKYEKDELIFGFHSFKSNRIVDIRVCPLLHGGINDLIPYIKHELRNIKPLKYEGSIELTRNPLTGFTLIYLNLKSSEKKRYSEIVSTLMEIESVEFIDYPDNPMDKIAFDIALKDLKAWVPAGSFSQSSFFNNADLVDLVMEEAGNVSKRSVLDLYCGWGNLSLPLAKAGAKVTGFDNDPETIDAANLSVSDNRLESADYTVMDDRDLSRHLKTTNARFDLIILDPPRTGASPVARLIAENTASRIIYVSCDPNTFARDMKTMSKHGRNLIKTHFIDMIPQTYHIETVNVIE